MGHKPKKKKPRSIHVVVPVTTLTPGQSVCARAMVFDKQGNLMALTPSSWVSDNPAVATVDSTGLVTAVAEGSCGITALLDALVSNVAAVTVAAAVPVPASITLSPPSLSLTVGQTQQLTAVIADAAGNPL